MIKNYTLLALLLLMFLGVEHLGAQNCNSNESEVIVEIQTDNYGYETSWTIGDGSTIYASGGDGTPYANDSLYLDTLCVPSSSCMSFDIFDSFGDGICCNYGNGYYNIYVDGQLIATGGNFNNNETVNFNCPPGSSCTSPDTAYVGGPYTTSFDDHWYVFTPDSTGMYEISTCGMNSCNTKIWVYDNCQANIDETVMGSIFYDDDNGGCGLQAVVSAALEAGETYIIRIGDANDNCGGPQLWTLQFNGPISGCTDPSACNYNPLATVSDTCIYPGDPACPDGPDLLLRQDVLENSMYVTTYFSNDACQVTEECIQGMGNRDLIRFTTHIENNGTQDYFIGNPTNQPGQFSNNNCHGHWHYEGYAEYILYDQTQTPTPIGFKSGFCVIDLVCDHGGTAQYGCGNMGITAGCGDIYDANLDCQWIDITDVPDGDYTFVARVNWGNQPDALGRHELTYDNNWAQVCFNLSRASGSPQITINSNCPAFTDCAGVPFGDAVPDCNGVCEGSAVRGDLNNDTLSNNVDLDLYTTGILDGSLNATECNDVHRDSVVNVYDATLVAQCALDTNECDYPTGITNIFDTAYISIANANFTDNYVDIYLRNPNEKLLAYQFTMSGIVVDSVVSLVNTAEYPVNAQWSSATNRILALSVEDSTINRSPTAQPLCRVYFSSVTASQICIDEFESAVSGIYQALMTKVEGPCVMPSSTSSINYSNFEVQIAPNPFEGETTFSFKNMGAAPLRLEIFDATGRLVDAYENIITPNFVLKQNKMTSGVYLYRISGASGMQSGKLMVK
jgi:hypothetical protein